MDPGKLAVPVFNLPNSYDRRKEAEKISVQNSSDLIKKGLFGRHHEDPELMGQVGRKMRKS